MKKIRTSIKGRKCKHPGCQHILSIYNHEALCHVHSGEGLVGAGSNQAPARATARRRIG
ncbi:MAG: hypothetical protein PHE65_06485 [Candidatus Omnitrophica bacterium]|nr:hypothetical protein [Candidatus Omnitrophota bacterium]